MATQPYTEEAPKDVVGGSSSADGAHGENNSPETKRKWYLGDDMGKRILGIVVAVLVVYLLYYAYQRHLATQASEGAIHNDDNESALTRESSSGSGDITPPAPTKTRNIVQPTTNVTPNLSAPATDSIAPNPQNGAAFAGSGKFQVYRQGNLTWRVDTESGSTCILFATMEEWKKPVVYNHACSNS